MKPRLEDDKAASLVASWVEREVIREALRRQPAPVCGWQSDHDAGIHLCWEPVGHSGLHRCGGCEEEWA